MSINNMINILNTPFIASNEDEKELEEIFSQYPFKLDNFQKHSIDKIRKDMEIYEFFI